MAVYIAILELSDIATHRPALFRYYFSFPLSSVLCLTSHCRHLWHVLLRAVPSAAGVDNRKRSGLSLAVVRRDLYSLWKEEMA